MTYKVLVQDVFEQYYRYMKHASHHDSSGMSLWQVMHDREDFEDRWFTKKGIGLVKSKKDGKILGGLEFESREHFIHWLLKWS